MLVQGRAIGKYSQTETEDKGVSKPTIRGARKQKDLLEWSRRVAEYRRTGRPILSKDDGSVPNSV
jgi:hypothetical protein